VETCQCAQLLPQRSAGRCPHCSSSSSSSSYSSTSHGPHTPAAAPHCVPQTAPALDALLLSMYVQVSLNLAAACPLLLVLTAAGACDAVTAAGALRAIFSMAVG
jgi:hypothetical protein